MFCAQLNISHPELVFFVPMIFWILFKRLKLPNSKRVGGVKELPLPSIGAACFGIPMSVWPVMNIVMQSRGPLPPAPNLSQALLPSLPLVSLPALLPFLKSVAIVTPCFPPPKLGMLCPLFFLESLVTNLRKSYSVPFLPLEERAAFLAQTRCQRS